MDTILGTVLLTSFLSLSSFGLAPGLPSLELPSLPAPQQAGTCTPREPYDFA